MSRNQPGARAPMRRFPAEQDPYNTPTTGQPAAWPPQQPAQSPAQHPAYGQSQPVQQQHAQHQGGYDQYGQPLPQSQGQNYYFPQGGQTADAEANYGYGARPAGQAPAFDRFPPPPAGYGQGNAAHGGQWGHDQGQDARGFDLGSYMPANAHGYAQGDAGHLQGHDPHGGFDAHGHGHPHGQGYHEGEADYDETLMEEDDEPRRSRRGLMIVGALVGAIGLGGALAYTYKTFIAPSPSRAPLVRAADPSANKVKPVVAGGREFAYTDKKLPNRLSEDGGPQGGDNAQGDDRAGDDPNSPRRVKIIPINPNGGPQQGGPVTIGTPPQRQGGPAPIAGIMLDSGPGQMAPPPVRAQPTAPPPPAPPQARSLTTGSAPAASPPPAPVKMVSAAPPTSIPAAAEPPAAPVKKAVARTKEVAAAPPASSGANGYVAVLSSQKSRMDALKAFADLQQKYGDVLASRTPDVQEANLGEKGLWYRAVVGPPGSRDAASGVCSQLKTAGFSGCWVAAY